MLFLVCLFVCLMVVVVGFLFVCLFVSWKSVCDYLSLTFSLFRHKMQALILLFLTCLLNYVHKLANSWVNTIANKSKLYLFWFSFISSWSYRYAKMHNLVLGMHTCTQTHSHIWIECFLQVYTLLIYSNHLSFWQIWHKNELKDIH